MRSDDPDPMLIRAVVNQIFPLTIPATVVRVPEGVSTHVYRVRRGAENFYLRVLPEEGASFAPEVRVHTLLRERGVSAPEVVYFEHYNEALQRSVMVTTEIAGCHIGRHAVDENLRTILHAAGRDLAVINRTSVEGFGWIRCADRTVRHLAAEHPTYRAFVYEHLDADLVMLALHVFSREEIVTIRTILDRHDEWLNTTRAYLVHGDFDVTHIYAQHGRYTGIIDFGEIRGGDCWYDLGHFHLHDGETLHAIVLPWLLEGYRAVSPLPTDAMRRICFTGLLIAIRTLARSLRKRPQGVHHQQSIIAIKRDLAALSDG